MVLNKEQVELTSEEVQEYIDNLTKSVEEKKSSSDMWYKMYCEQKDLRESAQADLKMVAELVTRLTK